MAGHRLCETKSWDVAINGLTVGDDKTAWLNLEQLGLHLDIYLTGRESYHPNALGHQLYAKAIRQAINSQSAPVTLPDPPINPGNLTPHKITWLKVGGNLAVPNQNYPISVKN